MKVTEKISIDEFNEKKFKSKFVEQEDNRKAVLTQYLQNYKNGAKEHFKKEADQYLKQIIEYKNEEENLNILSNAQFLTSENYFPKKMKFLYMFTYKIFSNNYGTKR